METFSYYLGDKISYCIGASSSDLVSGFRPPPNVVRLNRLNELTIKRLHDYSGPLIFLLRLGIINAGHFDKLSDRIASALAAQETRQAQGPKGNDSTITRLVDSSISRLVVSAAN